MTWNFWPFTHRSFIFVVVLEGRKFSIFSDQRLLTGAFFKARDPVSNRQKNQLAFISEFCTDIAHLPGIDNIVADALSHQHDDDQDVQDRTVIVHTVSHLVADVDLEQLAADQPQTPDLGAPNSLNLQRLKIPGCMQELWFDTSQSRIRFLVPPSWRRKIFENVHNLSHPSG